MRHVVLPHAVRNALPDLVSNTLEVVKLTSIASVVAAAILYLLVPSPVVRLLSRLENRAIARAR